jgi:hypothetical protein
MVEGIVSSVNLLCEVFVSIRHVAFYQYQIILFNNFRLVRIRIGKLILLPARK